MLLYHLHNLTSTHFFKILLNIVLSTTASRIPPYHLHSSITSKGDYNQLGLRFLKIDCSVNNGSQITHNRDTIPSISSYRYNSFKIHPNVVFPSRKPLVFFHIVSIISHRHISLKSFWILYCQLQSLQNFSISSS